MKVLDTFSSKNTTPVRHKPGHKNKDNNHTMVPKIKRKKISKQKTIAEDHGEPRRVSLNPLIV